MNVNLLNKENLHLKIWNTMWWHIPVIPATLLGRVVWQLPTKLEALSSVSPKKMKYWEKKTIKNWVALGVGIGWGGVSYGLLLLLCSRCVWLLWNICHCHYCRSVIYTGKASKTAQVLGGYLCGVSDLNLRAPQKLPQRSRNGIFLAS
jgi:hypothetical protein